MITAAAPPIGETRSISGAAPLRLFRPADPAAALGMAANYLRTKPAFANQRFGEWTDVLIGQINRGHYFLPWTATGSEDSSGGV